MFVENWMTPKPFTLPPHTSISAAALAMSQHHFRHLLIAESSLAGKRLLGIVSKYDIARAFPNNHNPFSPEVTEQTVAKPISTIMTHNVASVEPYCAIEEAAQILRTRHINALPVVRGGHLVGIITESDIFNAFVSMIGSNSSGTRLIVESENVRDALMIMAQLSGKHNLRILKALSFQDERSHRKVISTCHFAGKLSPAFSQDLVKSGFRVLKIA